MKNVRLLRLQSDYEAVRRLARLHPRIEVEGVSGNPPDRYRLVLKVKSLRERGVEVETIDRHRLEITLPSGYPRDPPVCRMLTPVFHPNVAPHAVCVGDHWTAAESLDLLVQRVVEMLAFQRYNTKSPLNGRAARWVEENVERLPIDGQEVFMDLQQIDRTAVEAAVCANCGGSREPLLTCEAGHRLCPDCASSCKSCHRLLCLVCGKLRCPACSCSNCGGEGEPRETCSAGHRLCPDCTVHCKLCGAVLCLLCGAVSGHRCPQQ